MKGLNNNKIFFYAPMPVLENLLYGKGLECKKSPEESVQLSNIEENGKVGKEDAMKNVDPATEEQKPKRLALQAIFVAEYPFLEGSRSPGKDTDFKSGHEFHEQQTNDVGCTDKVEEVDMLPFRKGTYIRLEVHGVPFEKVENFDPYHPILVGGISLEEENVGYMQARVKQHSWHTKLLRKGDPIAVYIGWRRYQTTPVYAMEETSETGSHEMLHCTPKHKYCLAKFWGPLAPSITELVVIQNVAEDKAAFQITTTGVLLANNQTKKIVKKHKQKGTPCKMIGNIALIKDMFTSNRDVARHKMS